MSRVEKMDGEVFLTIFNIPYEYNSNKIKEFYQEFKISSIETLQKGSFVFCFSNKENAIDFIHKSERLIGTRNARIDICTIKCFYI